MLSVCDHFEPFHRTDRDGALRRMDLWQEKFTRFTREFRDVDGAPPKQTFFYPIEQYDQEILDRLAALCGETGSEVELQLHHHDDNAENLAFVLKEGVDRYRSHGFLGGGPDGTPRFGFVHGNWALDNSDPRCINCGVHRELEVLRAAGCFADFTMPSAPHPTQARMVNSIYYARQTDKPRSHDQGTHAQVGKSSRLRDQSDHLLCVQGPLAPNFRKRKWGIVPRLENAELSGANLPTLERFDLWTQQAIGVLERPNWVFVKLHTHAALERNMPAFFGEPAHRFHEALASQLPAGVRLHYVSARETANLIHALEDGCAGSPNQHRDHLIERPAVLSSLGESAPGE
ncbi:hypothetical protein OVA24_20660 [Luteolibacter sp. SL250]|uniref:hypothetical protein n=1 Tax=Luteolibacter sp. SL250 TaxID=2995170 RepID=UPI002270AC7A|nr:hypothetical protein [Luteolibacter sp. SL250]WAC19635.1 hypothetical protein OVA24_20660 [Luteolibacter sp. SL250]